MNERQDIFVPNRCFVIQCLPDIKLSISRETPFTIIVYYIKSVSTAEAKPCNKTDL